MNIVIAIDSFKGSLTSLQAGNAAAEGIRRVYPDADIAVRPLADGGEGRLDAQTAMGKAPVGVARLAKKYGKPVIAFAGSATKDAATLNGCGIDAYFPILRTVCSLEEAMNTEIAA